MLNAAELADTERQLTSFRLASEDYLHTQAEIIQKYSALLDDYKRLQSDHEEARDSRDKYKQLLRGQDRDSFVLVLIDGDGYLFDDHLVSGGAEGGANAAHALSEAIKLHLRNMNLNHCRVMVRIYANLAGLSKALAHAKLAGPEKRSLAPFVANFNRSGDLFDFVDAGEPKENADFKIRANFRQFAESTQCKHIFFAACHDVGYVSDLQPYAGCIDRITLIKNHAFQRDFSRLNLREEELPGVFRSIPLSNDRFSDSIHTKPSNPSSIPSGDKGRGVCSFFQKGYCKHGDCCKFKHVKQIASPSPIKTPGLPKSRMSQSDHDLVTGYSNAKVTDMASPEAVRLLSGTTDSGALLEEQLFPDKIALNSQQHRLDPYTTPATYNDWLAYEARNSRRKLCKDHHLNGHCYRGSSCTQDHGKITPSTLNCLKNAARQMGCTRGAKCRVLTCFRGHICQKPNCHHRGGKGSCKLPGTAHISDLRVAKYVQGIAPQINAAYTHETDSNKSLPPTRNGSVANFLENHSAITPLSSGSIAGTHDEDRDSDDGRWTAAISVASLD